MNAPTASATVFAHTYTAAWNSGDPDAIAGFFATDGSIVIDGGEPWRQRAGVAAMATGCFAGVPDLYLVYDDIRAAGGHLVYLRAFTGHHKSTGIPLRLTGWAEWDLGADGLIANSRSWFDKANYVRQTTAVAA